MANFVFLTKKVAETLALNWCSPDFRPQQYGEICGLSHIRLKYRVSEGVIGMIKIQIITLKAQTTEFSDRKISWNNFPKI